MLVTVCMGNFRRASREFTVNTRHASFLWVFFFLRNTQEGNKNCFTLWIQLMERESEVKLITQVYEHALVHIHEECIYMHTARSVPSTPFPPPLPGRFSGIRQVICCHNGAFDIKVHPRVGNLLTLRDTTEKIWWEDTVFVLFTLYMQARI